jgi:hypothetical protein
MQHNLLRLGPAEWLSDRSCYFCVLGCWFPGDAKISLAPIEVDSYAMRPVDVVLLCLINSVVCSFSNPSWDEERERDIEIHLHIILHNTHLTMVDWLPNQVFFADIDGQKRTEASIGKSGLSLSLASPQLSLPSCALGKIRVHWRCE